MNDKKTSRIKAKIVSSCLAIIVKMLIIIILLITVIIIIIIIKIIMCYAHRYGIFQIIL